MAKCECSMRISILGDGCRYCQPQEHIDYLYGTIEDIELDYSQAIKGLNQLLGAESTKVRLHVQNVLRSLGELDG